MRVLIFSMAVTLVMGACKAGQNESSRVFTGESGQDPLDVAVSDTAVARAITIAVHYPIELDAPKKDDSWIHSSAFSDGKKIPGDLIYTDYPQWYCQIAGASATRLTKGPIYSVSSVPPPRSKKTVIELTKASGDGPDRLKIICGRHEFSDSSHKYTWRMIADCFSNVETGTYLIIERR